jgi:hypothetical protein
VKSYSDGLSIFKRNLQYGELVDDATSGSPPMENGRWQSENGEGSGDPAKPHRVASENIIARLSLKDSQVAGGNTPPPPPSNHVRIILRRGHASLFCVRLNVISFCPKAEGTILYYYLTQCNYIASGGSGNSTILPIVVGHTTFKRKFADRNPITLDFQPAPCLPAVL